MDQVIPIPGVETFTNNYRKGIVKHLSTVIDKEDSRYRVLPTVTDQMRIHKADVYADLFNLRQVRERLSRTHTAGSMHSVDGSTAPPHSLPHDTISPFTRPASIRGHQVLYCIAQFTTKHTDSCCIMWVKEVYGNSVVLIGVHKEILFSVWPQYQQHHSGWQTLFPCFLFTKSSLYSRSYS